MPKLKNVEIDVKYVENTDNEDLGYIEGYASTWDRVPDAYGDIVLERNLKGVFGNNVYTNDLYPLFRGPFVSPEGVEYSDCLDSLVSPFNITLRGKTKRNDK